MEVELLNFRCHDEFKCSFISEEICLIQGISGIGKSTIFEAIYWCLFGKLQKIAPVQWDATTQRKSRTTVKLTFKSLGIKIIRQTNSNILKVKFLNPQPNKKSKKSKRGKILEDTVAQEYINNIFGSCDFWVTTSYLRQKQMNKFLTGSTSEKLELINTMAFQDENPAKYIEVVDDELKVNERSLLKLETKHEITIDSFQKKLDKNNLTEKSLKKVVDIKELQTTIESNDAQIRKLKNQISEHESQKNALETLKKKIGKHTIESIESQTQSYRNDMDIIKSNSSVMSLQKTYRILVKKIKETEAKLKTQSKLIFHENKNLTPGKKFSDRKNKFSPKEIREVQISTEKYQSNVSRAENLKVKYSKTEISTEIKTLKNIIKEIESFKDHQRKIKESEKIKDEITTIQEKVKSLEQQIVEVPDFSQIPSIKEIIENKEKTLSRLNQEIKKFDRFKDDPEFKRLKQILKDPPLECPKCNSNLKYNPQNRSLSTVENFNESSLLEKMREIELLAKSSSKELSEKISRKKDSLEEFRGSLDKLKDHKKKSEGLSQKKDDLLRTLKKLQTQVLDLPELEFPPGLESMNIDQLRKRFHLLSEIKFYDQPEYTVDDMLTFNNTLDFYELQVELNGLKENLTNYDQKLMESEIELPKFSISELKEKIQELEKIKILLEKLELMVVPELDVESVRNEIVSLNKSNSRILNKIKVQRIIEDLRELQKEIEPRKKSIKELKKRINSLGKLKQLFIDAEYASYERVAERINMFLEDIVSSLFIDPIKIQVNMFKKLKTKDRVKPVVNLSVYHRENEIDLNIMSGGEKDRISVAITLAMMKMSNSPIVLIDETLGSLSKSDRERAMKVFSKYGKKSKKMFLCIGQCDKSKWYDRELNVSTV